MATRATEEERAASERDEQGRMVFPATVVRVFLGEALELEFDGEGARRVVDVEDVVFREEGAEKGPG